MIDWIVIMIPLVAFWFAGIVGVQRIPAFNRKPFTCPKCMAFWLALNYQFYLGFNLNSVVIIALSSFAAYMIEITFEKLKIFYHK